MSSSKTQDFKHPASSPFLTEVQQLATAHKLGSLQSSYTQSTTRGTRLIANTLAWFILALISLYFLIEAILKIGQSLGDPPTLRSIGAIGVISLIVLGGCCIQGWYNLLEYRYLQREQVHIYEDGFVYLQGRQKSYVLRWDEIDALLRGTLDPKHPKEVMRDRLTIITDKEQMVMLVPRVQQRMELCDKIERIYTDYRLPGMMGLYHLGENLEFGDLALNKEYVSKLQKQEDYEEETVPWSEVESFDVTDQFTRVWVRDQEKPWFEALTGDIENALLLKEILANVH